MRFKILCASERPNPNLFKSIATSTGRDIGPQRLRTNATSSFEWLWRSALVATCRAVGTNNFKGVDICLLHDPFSESVQTRTAQSTRAKALNVCSTEYEMSSRVAVVAQDLNHTGGCRKFHVNGLTFAAE